MSGPARAGLFIYAKNLVRLAGFYESLLAMSRRHSSGDRVILHSPDIQITVHAMPATIAESIDVSEPPVKRDGAAYKFFFTVPSFEVASAAAAALGGEVLREEWQGPGFRADATRYAQLNCPDSGTLHGHRP